jgi:hypothetical protein
VLSHTGLPGNDAADEAAVKTAKQETPVDVADPSDSLALHSLYWIARAHASADGTKTLRYASDRDNGLQKLLAQCPRVLRGDAPKTEKGKAWDAALPDLDGRLSNLYITSSSSDEWTRQNVLKMRHNCFYTARHKMLYGRGGNGKCPLCQNSKDPEGYLDSGPHILGGCPDPALSSLYVLRHDAAVKLIADTLNRHTNTGVLIMDAGKAEDSPEYCSGKRLPAWLLPEMDETTRLKLRPDILYIPTLRDTTKAVSPHLRPCHPIFLLEIGYCNDVKHARKIAEKSDQHEQCAQALRAAGWTVHYPHLPPPAHAPPNSAPASTIITLGHTGTITKYLTPTLKALGVPATAATTCAEKLHRMAVAAMGNIIRARRARENEPRRGHSSNAGIT